jgi:hypothetical protein
MYSAGDSAASPLAVRAALAANRVLYSSVDCRRRVTASADSPSRMRSFTLPASEDSPHEASWAWMIALADCWSGSSWP